MTTFYVRYEVVVDADNKNEAQTEAEDLITWAMTMPTAIMILDDRKDGWTYDKIRKEVDHGEGRDQQT
jgi:hypothetical protein